MIRNVSIKKSVYRGFGLGYIFGKPIFMLHAYPEETVSAQIRKKGGKVLRGEVLEILENASAHRRAVDCPFSGVCGGCHYQEIDYGYQLQLKHDILLENLHYIGKLEGIPDITINPSPQQFRYRPQCGFAVDSDDDHWKLGYYRYESQNFLEVHDCLLLIEPIIALKPQLEEFINSHQQDLYGLDYIDIRMSSNGSAVVLTCGFRDVQPVRQDWLYHKCLEAFPILSGLLFRAWKTERLWGSGEIEETVLGKTYRIGAGSFFQNNRFQWAPLQQLVRRSMALEADDRLLDLFCGIGFWSIGLARPGCEIQGYEVNDRSVHYATFNARQNDCFPAEFGVRDLSQGLGPLPFSPNKIIINPPRSGCSKKLLNDAAALGAHKLLYVSCDPPSLARDIARLVRKGSFVVQSIDLIDMFPQTYSIETAVLLNRT